MPNTLFYGDNLDVMREHVSSASVDLVYLDPPFNSDAVYNILFKSKTGDSAVAQIEAFKDTWKWGDEAENAFDEVMNSGDTRTSDMLRAMRSFLGESDTMAYLSMMAVRLLELYRVLKPTGSLFLHCDPTASHYLKILLDAVFGRLAYRNEVVWIYTGPGSPGIRQFLRKHDVIFWYSKGATWTFNADAVRIQHSDKTKANYKSGLVGSGFVGADHLIHEGGKVPEDWWPFAIAARGSEYLGYPTQKPLKLLERIVAAASNPGDLVLDPFCGCGTALHAAQKLDRVWTGIDVTHLAISLIEKRLNDAFADVTFDIVGRPKDLASAQELARRDKHEFQKWITTYIGGHPYRGGVKGADGGVDGLIYFDGFDAARETMTKEKAIISVKGGETRGVGMVAELVETISRQKAAVGILVLAANPTRQMETRAAAAGVYDLGIHGRFARVQILLLAEIFQGKRPRLPNIDRTMFRKARREGPGQNSLELD